MHPTSDRRPWWSTLWPNRKEAIAAFCAFVIFAGLDLIVYLVGSHTSGWLGPHAALVMHLTVDVSLLLLARFPTRVAGLAIAVSVAMLLSDLFALGLLVPLEPATQSAVPVATPAIVITLVRLVDRRTAFALVLPLTVLASRLWDPSWATTPFGLLNTAGPALAALYLEARRNLVASLRDRAERAEREQSLLAEQARTEERRRLAGEMHDVVTHRLSLMVLHAGALGMTSKEDSVRSAAEEIRRAGTQALDELRDLVGVLRSAPSTPDSETEGTAPAPVAGTSVDPAELVAEARALGEVVELDVGGDDMVSPVIARTAYRVAQEALTNARKHAPGASVRVRLRYRAGGLRMEIDNGPASTAPDRVLAGSGSGTGLIGLRQRVELIGGTLTAGATDGGGYRLAAILPAYVPTQESDLHDPGDRRR